jgi:hypothetical protein
MSRFLMRPSGRIAGQAALGGDVLASHDEKVLDMWESKPGERICSCRSWGVTAALSSLFSYCFLARARGDLLSLPHLSGRSVMQLQKIEIVRATMIDDIGLCGARVAAASHDKSTAMMSAATCRRLAVREGDIDELFCVSLNEKRISTGSREKSTRLFDERTF